MALPLEYSNQFAPQPKEAPPPPPAPNSSEIRKPDSPKGNSLTFVDGIMYTLARFWPLFVNDPTSINEALVAVHMARKSKKPPKRIRHWRAGGTNNWRTQFNEISNAYDKLHPLPEMARVAKANGRPKDEDINWT